MTQHFAVRPGSPIEDQVAIVKYGRQTVLVEFLEGPWHEQRHWVPADHVRIANPDEETIESAAARRPA